jgi:hypothetical protein
VTRRRLVLPAGLVGAAIVGAVAAVAVRGGAPAPAGPAPPPVTTATVVRTDLSTTVNTEGTLGYAPTAPLVNRLAGTYTQLPVVGATINAGQVLYRVDNMAVVLMTGTVPAWRPFATGMSDGPDVSELQSNLVALGDAHGLFSAPTSHYDALTADAVQRWQAAEGYAATGQIDFGEVVFLPAAALVGAENVAVGQGAAPGEIPYQVTTTVRTVTVPLNPTLPEVAVGEAVEIVLPTTTVPGHITALGPAPPGSSSGSGRPSGQGGSSGSDNSSSPASSIAVVTPDQPATTGNAQGEPVQAVLTTQSATGVLVVPVSALLALAGGGYGLEVVSASGTHLLVGVTTGLFAGNQVQVSGAGIGVGTKVVVAQ